MFKRLFFAMIGLGAGVALGIWTVRKLEAAQRRLSPDHLASQAGVRAQAARGRWAAAIAEGRAAAAAREAELRAVYRAQEPPSPDPGPEPIS